MSQVSAFGVLKLYRFAFLPQNTFYKSGDICSSTTCHVEDIERT